MSGDKKYSAGESFNSFDEERIKTLRRTREMLDEYNSTGFDEAEKKQDLLHKMLGSCGEDVTVQTPFKVLYGKNLYIGDHVFVNYNSSILDGGEIRIGNRVLIGPDTKIYAGSHSLIPDERIVVENGKMRLVSIPQPVTIGDDVWIGGNVTVVPGVAIGNGAVIAAGSVVVNNVPERVLVAGNPARVIKSLEGLSI